MIIFGGYIKPDLIKELEELLLMPQGVKRNVKSHAKIFNVYL